MMLLGHGKVYGARYYTAEPVGGNWWEMETWCFNTFGNSGEKMWNINGVPEPLERWYMNNSKFWFREEADLTLFLLKWQ